MKPRVPVPLLLLLITAFLAPILGGYLANDQTQFDGSFVNLLVNLLSGSGSDVPLLIHALLALPVLVALTWSLWTRRIQPVPNQNLTAAITLLIGVLGLSILFSDYKALSVGIFLEWVACAVAFFAVIATAGRRMGPFALIVAIAAGTSVVALMAVAEYGQYRATDPSHRVFAGWVNPNATAAVLLIGFFCCLGIALVRSRVESMLAIIAASLAAFAILLTGSKGAISLGIPIGTLAFAAVLVRPRGWALAISAVAGVLAGLFSAYCFLKNAAFVGVAASVLVGIGLVLLFGDRETRKVYAGRFVSPFVLAALLATALVFTTPHSGGASSPTSVVQRSSTAQLTEAQSVDFRLNLWKSAFFMIRNRPLIGYGIGSYRFESPRAGLSTATVLTHNVYLQLWAESGLLALLSFVAVIVVWLRVVLRNQRHQPMPRVVLSAAVVAAIASLLTHSLVDSDPYYFGLGILFFMLLGIGILLSTDSVAPEYTPSPLRRTAAVSMAALAILLLYFAHIDSLKSEFRFARAQRDENAIQALAGSLETLAPFDGEAVYLTAWTKPPEEVEPTFRRALDLLPISKIARVLATTQLGRDELSSAEVTLRRSLERDPNNFLTLSLLIKVQQSAGHAGDAIATARRLIAIEQTPYFKVRSIAEDVPTETYLVRFNVLAPAEKNLRARAELYRDGVLGMLSYARTTATTIKTLSKGDPNVPALYGTWSEARNKLTASLEAARQAARLYRTLGDPKEAAAMDEAAGTFAALLA